MISTSFADIFYNNCHKNGILPITVSADDRDALMADAADVENPELSIDLETQTIRRPNGVEVGFDIDLFRKKCLLEGLDDIGLTLEKGGRSTASRRLAPTRSPALAPGRRSRQTRNQTNRGQDRPMASNRDHGASG